LRIQVALNTFAYVLCDQLLAVLALLLLSCALCLSLLLSERLVGAVVHLCAAKEGRVVILSVQLSAQLEPDWQVWVDLYSEHRNNCSKQEGVCCQLNAQCVLESVELLIQAMGTAAGITVNSC
jgi:hypothetical protein